MNFFSLINAQMQLSCNETTVPVNPSTPHTVTIDAKGTNNEKHVVFIESDGANFDNCKFDISKDGQFNLGMNANPANTVTTAQPIKTLICNQKGVVNSTFPLTTTPAPVVPGVTCTSLADPHITTFAQHKFDHQGVGDFWLAKSDLWDVQVHQDLDPSIAPTASLNTKVGLRYMDSVWVATLANPKFTCNSANKCVDYPLTGDTLPGNIKVAVTLPDPKWLDVSVTIPADAIPKVTTSICKPTTVPVGDVGKTFAIDPKDNYFGAGVTVPKPIVPAAFKKCTLPATCDGVFPPVVPPKANPTMETAIPKPTPQSYGTKNPATADDKSTKPPTPPKKNAYSSVPKPNPVGDESNTKPYKGIPAKMPVDSATPPSPIATQPDNIVTTTDVPSTTDNTVSNLGVSTSVAHATAPAEQDPASDAYSSASQFEFSIMVLSLIIVQ